jgi:Zn-dependent protease with chaperone function
MIYFNSRRARKSMMSADEQLPGYGPARGERILAGFHGAIRRVEPTFGYWLSLAVAGAALLLTALIYWSLIAGLVWLVVWTSRFSAHVWGFALWASEIGLLFSLLQPLVARFRIGDASLRLDRNQDPLLFDFVDRLCQATGMPELGEVRMTCEPSASAWTYGRLRRTRVLQLGLPLVESMSLQQVAGLVAHELGRLGLRAESRFVPAARRISSWLEGGAYLRQRADALAASSQATMERRPLVGTLASWVALPLLLGLTGVAWLVEALHLLAAAATSTLRRQDEQNADRYLAEVAGSKGVAATLREQAALGLVFVSVRESLQQGWLQGRLPEDLPRLTATLRQRDRVKIDHAVTESFQARKRGLFRASPSVEERIGKALQVKAAGIFHSDLPAIVLLREPEELARRVTFRFYQDRFGRQLRRENLVPNDAFLAPETAALPPRPPVAGQWPLATPAPPGSAPHAERTDPEPAVNRVFGVLVVLRPLPFSHPLAAAPRLADRPQLEAARNALARDFPSYFQHLERYVEAFHETIELRLSLTWLTRPREITDDAVPTQFTLYSGTLPDLDRDLELASGRLSRAGARASEFERLQVRRVALCLEILGRRPEMNAALPPAAIAALLAAASIPHQLAPRIVDVEQQQRVLAILGQQRLDTPGVSHLRQLVDSAAKELHAELDHLRFQMATLDETPRSELGGMSLAHFCFPFLPEPEAAAELSQTVSLALFRLMSSQLPILAQLAAITEQVERELGFAPIDWPPLPPRTGHLRSVALAGPGMAPPGFSDQVSWLFSHPAGGRG